MEIREGGMFCKVNIYTALKQYRLCPTLTIVHMSLYGKSSGQQTSCKSKGFGEIIVNQNFVLIS